MFRSNSDTLDTDCETIQQVADEFHWFFFLWNIPPEKLLARSFCPVVAATEVPEQKNTGTLLLRYCNPRKKMGQIPCCF